MHSKNQAVIKTALETFENSIEVEKRSKEEVDLIKKARAILDPVEAGKRMNHIRTLYSRFTL